MQLYTANQDIKLRIDHKVLLTNLCLPCKLIEATLVIVYLVKGPPVKRSYRTSKQFATFCKCDRYLRQYI